MSSILQYQPLSLHLYLLRDEALSLLKDGHSKRMGIQQQTPAKTLFIQFHFCLLINKQWLADFKILYISSTYTNITMPVNDVNFVEIARPE